MLAGFAGPLENPFEIAVADHGPDNLSHLHHGVVVFGGGGFGAENVFQPDPVVFFGVERVFDPLFAATPPTGAGDPFAALSLRRQCNN